MEKFGSDTIDILVNNAGVAFNRKLIDTSEEEWNQTINSNLKGAFLFAKAVLPYMISKKSGVILNVNSGAGKAGFSNLSAYCASKFGLLGLAESLAIEVNAHNNNIRVLTIFLGKMATKMWQEYDFNYYEKNKNNMLRPRDVAAKIVKMILTLKPTKIEIPLKCTADVYSEDFRDDYNKADRFTDDNAYRENFTDDLH